MNLAQCIKGGSKEGKSGWLISFHYDEQVVEAIKRSIPHIEREWRESERVWWISEKYQDELKRIFSNFEALAFLQGRLFEV